MGWIRAVKPLEAEELHRLSYTQCPRKFSYVQWFEEKKNNICNNCDNEWREMIHPLIDWTSDEKNGCLFICVTPQMWPIDGIWMWLIYTTCSFQILIVCMRILIFYRKIRIMRIVSKSLFNIDVYMYIFNFFLN